MPWGDGDNLSPDIEQQLEAPILWIGLYVAAASLICCLAMAFDAFHGFRGNKLWFPSRLFSLNATSLTLLAVAMKLPVDLTTRMYAPTDRLAKVSSLVLLSISMGNFMTSLGTMDNKEILMNITALAILVVTVIVNVCIQIIQMRSFLDGRQVFPEEIVALFAMLFLLFMLIASAIMVPATKKYLESKYQEIHRMSLKEEARELGKSVTVDKLRMLVRKYWVMGETSCPQFVIARSVTCTTSGAMCVLIALVLAEAEVQLLIKYRAYNLNSSSYRWSTSWILLAQTIGVVVGTIAPAFRWFVAIRYKWFGNGNKGLKDELKVESYWIQKLVEWKDKPLPLQTKYWKWKKLVHDTKGLFLRFFIGIQILIILASKLLLLVSTSISSPICWFCHNVKKLKPQRIFDSGSSRILEEVESGETTQIDFSRYVLLLEGEAELPTGVLENIYKEVDKIMEMGKRQQPKDLIQLLCKSQDFNGVRDFDSKQVLSLHSKEPPNCWSLPLVTLTSIAIALPNISSDNVSRLLSSVSQGIHFVKLIEKSLYRKEDLVNMRSAANVVWVRVELYHKWQDKDLHEISLKGRTSKEILQELSCKAEKDVVNFKQNVKDFFMENPVNWPVKILAANSMYRISRTLLLAYDDDNPQTDEELFERLSTMIADILAACLTNIARVIPLKCHQKAIQRRDKSVRKAALLLGEAEEIIKILQQRTMPSLNPDKAAFIEEWRATLEWENTES